MDRPIRLRGLLVSTADACAVGCRFCFRADIGRDVLSLTQYARALSRLRELGVDELCLSGGEPTDHPEFRQLVRVALQFGFRCAVVTAAREGRRLDALARVAGMLSHVTVSADSREAERLGHTGRTVSSTAEVFSALGHTRASLHVTAYELGDADLEEIRTVVTDAGVGLEVSPLLPSQTFRFDNPNLQRDLDLIEHRLGLSPELRVVVDEYYQWLAEPPVRDCQSERLYLSADGYLRRCPYDTEHQVSVDASREEIGKVVQRMLTEPPHTNIACVAICRPSSADTDDMFPEGLPGTVRPTDQQKEPVR
ncbi:radical SAM protein [Streptomyces sp. NPDC012616]|uniref:radical SAM protein n=1 Tax=Streptomyces sp. NPDC012616 TaxID=3364840 RepID=UPI0036F17E70